MHINEIIFAEIHEEFYAYSTNTSDMLDFMLASGGFEARQALSIRVIEKIMTKHGKKSLLRHVVELARVEMGIRELEPWARDHVVHALLCFALGIYIQKKQLAPYERIRINPFQWKLACLFHDVGYPLQLSRLVIAPFAEKINEIRDEFGIVTPPVLVEIIPKNLELLGNNQNAFDLIQGRLDSWQLRIDARGEYESRIESGDVCHGMISALSVLKIIDFMYEKFNPTRSYAEVFSNDDISWNQHFFDNDVVSACSAIYIHNLPRKCFSEAKISKKIAPLAFLLKLSDVLQEWERPSRNSPSGFAPSLFDISMNGALIRFKADIPDERKEQIALELEQTLESPGIHII